MSTVRIQLRRGLASEWTAADTALNASGGLKLAGGEVGLETDTGTFKFGDGTTRWSDLPYALENTLGDYVLLEDVGVANGVASLNSSGKVPASQLDISELSQDAVNTALVAGTGISKTYDDNANTITLAVNASTSNISEGTNLYFTDERAQDAVNTAIVAGTNLTKSYDDNANTITISIPNDIALSGYVDANQILGNSGAIDGELTAGSLTVSGNLTVNGTTTTVNSTTLVVDDPIIKIADGNSANSVDIGFAGSRTIGGTYSHTGLVKDASDGNWKLFSGVSTEPGSTVDFTTWTKDNIEVGGMYALEAQIGNVTNTEIQYLSGVGSNIKDQIDAKLATSTAASTYAPIDSPTFTGTVAGITKSMVGLGNIDNTTDLGKPVSSATQTALDLKANLAGPTFTGTVVLPAFTSIGNVTSTEIGYIDGVTSSIQGQLDAKASSSDLSTHNSDTTDVHGITDTAALATKTYADSAVETHQGDTTNIHGIADTANLATKTYADSAVTTHQNDSTNIHGIADTANLVTLDGTETLTAKRLTSPKINEDVAVTATATELNILDGATLSTTELNYVDGVTSAIQTQMNDKAPLNSPTFTGTVTLPNNTISQSMMADDSVGTNEIGGLAVTNEKLAGSIGWDKLAISSTISSTELGYLDGVTSSIQTQLDDKLSKTGGTMTGALTLSADPSSSLHAATKQYVDNTASGVIAKPQVLGATNSNIDATYNNGTAGVGATLTHNTNGVFPADAGGASGWAVGKGVLVRSQTNKAQNGRYFISNMGSVSTPYVLTRCSYCDEASEIPGSYIFVQDGTFAGTGWIQVVADPATFVVGTDNIDVFQFSGSGTITAGTGITVSGNEVSISTGAITSAMIANGAIVDADVNASAAIAQSKISGLTSDLAAKAPLASPTFTGTVTVAASGVAFTDGTQTKEGVASRTPIIQKSAGYTLSALTHRDSLIEMGSGSAITLSIPTDATLNFPIGTSIDILQTNTGQVTIAAVTPGTTTVNATPGLKLRTQWSSCTLFKRAANTWVVYGDLTA